MTKTLRVVQLNIGSLIEADWENRRHEIVAWLNKLQPDVVCLQEVWQSSEQENTAGWLAGQLDAHSGTDTASTDTASTDTASTDTASTDTAPGQWHWAFGGFAIKAFVPDPSLLFGSAVISRWKIDFHQAWRLPVAEGADRVARGVPWELFHAETAGLDLFSTHLTAAPSDGLHRIQQVQAIDSHIKAVRGDRDKQVFGGQRKGMPPILCGDFNAEPESDEIRFLQSLTPLEGKTTFYQDAWRVAGADGPGYTQDWRQNKTAAELNVHRKRIDYVFVGDAFRREGSGGRVLDAEVVFNSELTGVMASDHWGLSVEVLWPDRPAS